MNPQQIARILLVDLTSFNVKTDRAFPGICIVIMTKIARMGAMKRIVVSLSNEITVKNLNWCCY